MSRAIILSALFGFFPAFGQTVGNCLVFPSNNVWNTPVDTLPVHAKSAAYVTSIGASSSSHADFGAGLYQGAPIGIPFISVPGSQPKVNITFQYSGDSDPGPYPIPANAPIEGGSSSNGDRHVLVIDQDNCVLYEVYAGYPQPNGTWTAGSGAIFDLKKNLLRPQTWTSADAAGLPIFPGLARYDEVAAGEIRHALRFTAPQTQKAFVWPGRHYASNVTDTNYPPMGQRFRLKSTFNMSGFSADTQVILRALQKYGIILADNGSAWYVSGAPDDRWNNTHLSEFRNLHGTDFEAVDESSLIVDPNSAAVIAAAASFSLSRSSLNFGYNGSVVTAPQNVLLTFGGPSSGSWTASSNQPNIAVSPSTGTGNGVLQIAATPGSSGFVTITAAGFSQQVQVRVVSATPAIPTGSFDTPATGTSGIAGAVAVTGWALDNIEISSVGIWRERIGSEPVASNGLVLIGNAVFVPDARPDVYGSYPTVPLNYRAGWGYMLLSNFLPAGNGTFKLHAIATGKTGLTSDLGTHTITVDNAHASKPFGSIDTPDQGGVVSGASYVCFGWALTQNPYMIPLDGSTITVTVDGVTLGHPVYNQFRSDIANAFPNLANSAGAVGLYVIDTTKLTNGVHTLGWVVYDNQGRGDGIGSRYFTVQNAGGLAAPESGAAPLALWKHSRVVEMEELGRIQLEVGATSGYLLVNGEHLPLPVGSTLKNGVFYWHAGPGFVGDYELRFDSGQAVHVRIRRESQPRIIADSPQLPR